MPALKLAELPLVREIPFVELVSERSIKTSCLIVITLGTANFSPCLLLNKLYRLLLER
jgi:hypothetical protein